MKQIRASIDYARKEDFVHIPDDKHGVRFQQNILDLIQTVTNHQLKSCPCYRNFCGYCQDAVDLRALLAIEREKQ